MKPGPLCLLLSLLLVPVRSGAAALALDAPLAARSSSLGALGTPDAEAGVWHFSRSRHRGRFQEPDRVGSEIRMGLLGGVIGGSLGLAGSFLIPCRAGGPFEPACLSTRLGGAVAGGLVGLPVGVWLGGGMLKGEGSLLATLLGSGVGGAGALGLIHAFPSSSVGYLCLLALPMTFSIVAYEVTHNLRQPPPPRDSPPESSPLEPSPPESSRAP